MEFIQVVLDWCTRKYNPSTSFESLEHLGGFILRRFKAVPLIANNQTNGWSVVRVQGRLEEAPRLGVNVRQLPLTGSRQARHYAR